MEFENSSVMCGIVNGLSDQERIHLWNHLKREVSKLWYEVNKGFNQANGCNSSVPSKTPNKRKSKAKRQRDSARLREFKSWKKEVLYQAWLDECYLRELDMDYEIAARQLREMRI